MTREERIEQAARAFLARIDEITASSHFKGIFTLAQIHGVTYVGENWTTERSALMEALAVPKTEERP